MLDGAGVLLCGGPGAGKSSLAVKCALHGWTLVCDDASFLIRRRGGRTVVGNPYLVRFRPETRALFPFLADCHIDQRVNGKPTIHLPTADVPSIATALQAEVRWMVLLQRTEGARARLVRRSEEIIQHVRHPPYGDPGVIAEQELTLQALSGVPAFDLHYSDLDDAVRCLTGLVRDGVGG
jgi:serine kinase of HPr protein (carbohydrate metabolism regulator)